MFSMMSIPTDDDISSAVLAFLKTSDLSTTSKKSILSHVESVFSCTLFDKKELISEVLNNFAAEAAKSSETQVDEDNIELFGTVDEDIDEDSTHIRDDSTVKKKRGGFTVPMQLSTELSEFIGSVTCSRTEIVKRLWDYIKSHNLQNVKDKREILCDETLKKIFKRPKLTMFSMNKYLSGVRFIKSIFQIN